MKALLRPWRARTWWALTHVLLDAIVGAGFMTIVVTLLAVTVGTLPVLPVAVAIGWMTFVVASGLGRFERSRLAVLLGVALPDPHRPLPTGSWWARLKVRVRTASRWREMAYLVTLGPLGVVTTSVALVVWCGSLALGALPAYISSLHGRTANLGPFRVGSGSGSAAYSVIGIVGVAVVAPWVTIGLAGVDTYVARRLLGPARSDEMRQRVTRLEASRAAAIGSAEAERRRIERDLHDGAQQRLVSVAMYLGRAQERFDTDPDQARELVRRGHEDSKAALAELRQLVRGFHPAILEDRGLDAALSAIVARVPVPVTLTVDVASRPSAAVESTAYFVVTEALTNVTKHARATKASVSIARRNDRLVVEVSDDGIGGAVASGNGLLGLEDRVNAVGGWMRVLSPVGGPTTLLVEVPCES